MTVICWQPPNRNSIIGSAIRRYMLWSNDVAHNILETEQLPTDSL
jgi:hypothetical protein